MTVDERELGALVRELPTSAINPTRRAELRDRVLGEVSGVRATRARRRSLATGIALAVAAAAAALVVLVSSGDRTTIAAGHRATLRSTEAADLEHTARIEHGINDEIVRLRSGRISIAVERLGPRERFRVVAGDGEVEVRGTAFDVDVIDDRLSSVVVHHGLVEVRVAGAPTIAVAGGEQWSRGQSKLAVATPDAMTQVPAPPDRDATAEREPPPQSAIQRSPTRERERSSILSKPTVARPATEPAAEPPASPSPPRPPTSEPSAELPASSPSSAAPTPEVAAAPQTSDSMPPARPSSPTERAFRAGREALRDGDFGTAAERFRQAIAADPAAPLVEDARYWLAIALVRAGRDADARRAVDDFLTRHPHSPDVGRASLVLGNLLVKSGELAAARTRFAAALADPDEDVRRAARAALDALPP